MIFSVIGVALLVVAAIVFLIRRRTAARQAASLSWPTCEGEVTRSWVHSYRDKDRDTQYMARVKYAYRIDGVGYESERIAWGGRASSGVATAAQAVVARYPVGSSLRVHYNPGKPKEAVLEPSETGGLSLMTYIGVGFAAVVAAFVVAGLFVG